MSAVEPATADEPQNITQGESAEEYIEAEFRGTASEYFRIWSVNLLLTIITAGIYSPWAKVRNKRYFYGNTWLADANFEYHAKPLAILVARLILLAVFVGAAYWAGEDLVRNTYYSLGLALFLPWAIVRGLSFNARNSSWAGIRFSFVRDYLPLYLILLPLLIINTLLGISAFMDEGELDALMSDWQLPDYLSGVWTVLVMYLSVFVLRAYYRYKAGRHRLGNLRFYLHNVSFMSCFKTLAMPILGASVAFILAGALLFFAVKITGLDREVAIGIVFGGAGIVAFLVLVPFMQAALFKLYWKNLRADNGAYFVCNIHLGAFAIKILSVNTMAVIFSLGLLHPWAKVRKTKYLAQHISIFAPVGALAALVGQSGKKESALGEELDASEGFDFDVGLI